MLCNQYGISWHPFLPNVLACGGEDGLVRIFKVDNEMNDIIFSVKCHESKIFVIQW